MQPVETTESDMETLLMPQEVAQIYRIGVSTVYHMAARGELPGIKIGGRLRFRRGTINQDLARREKTIYGEAA